jgi:hypothetical protein
MKITAYSFLLTLLSFFILNVSPLHGQAAVPKVKKIPFHGKLQSVDAAAQTVTLSGKSARVFHLAPTTRIIDGAGNPTTLSAATVGEDVGGSYTKDTSGVMTLASIRFGAKIGKNESASLQSDAVQAGTTPTAPHASTTPTPPVAGTSPREPLGSLTPGAPTAPPLAAASTPAATEPASTTSSKAKKQRFTGKLVSVDATANTIVVHGRADETFIITASTKVTDASGSAVALSSAAPGAKVSGSYTAAPDGTMTLYSLKLGK